MRGSFALTILFFYILFHATHSLPPPDGLTQRTLTSVVRDFKAYSYSGGGHIDFENVCADDRAYASPFLNADRKPSYNSNTTTVTTHGAKYFNQWFYDVPGVNLRYNVSFNVTWDSTANVYSYRNDAYYPIDYPASNGFGLSGRDDSGKLHNYGFTMELHSQFTYQKGQYFSFTGDDDILVYINNTLFVNLGGVHGAQFVNYSLEAYASKLGLVLGGTYNFDFFFCERHTSGSHFLISTSMPIISCQSVDVCSICNGNTTVDPCTLINCNSTNGKCSCSGANAGQCICNAGWTSSNNPGANGLPTQCDQYCGNGVIEGDEECDPPSATGCCTSSCTFASAGSSCNGTNKCLIYTCGSRGTCSTAPVVCNGDSCNTRSCDSSTGQCVAKPFANGTICSSSSNTCIKNLCQSGSCTPVNQDGISCGDSTNNGCSQPFCNGGTCSSKPINAGGTCDSNPDDYCNVYVCLSDGTCGPQPANNGGSCPPPSGSSDSDCNQYQCSNGQCVSQTINEGGPCSETTPPSNPGYSSCQQAICQSQKCILVPANAGQPCDAAAASTCEASFCDQSGNCVINDVNEGQSCSSFVADTQCTQSLCQSGDCNQVPYNIGQNCTPSGSPLECSYYQCDNTGTCSQQLYASGTPCGSNADQCNPNFCNPTGNCTVRPVVCSDSPLCLRQRQTCQNGACAYLGGQCPAHTDCCEDNCQYSPNGTKCGNVEDTTCTQHSCNAVGGCLTFKAPDNTSCPNDVPAGLLGECYQPLCQSGSCAIIPKDQGAACSSLTGSQCSEPLCDGAGTCRLYPRRDGESCTDYPEGSYPECNNFRCSELTCTSYSKVTDAPGTNFTCTILNATDCAAPQCDASGGCSLTPFPEGTNCTSLSATDCAIPTCDGAGSCRLAPLASGTSCNSLNSGDCTEAQCDGDGNCGIVVNETAVGANCSAYFGQCYSSACDVNGSCSAVPLSPGTSCSLVNNNTCMTPVCDGNGTCALVPANEGDSCSAPAGAAINDCSTFICTQGQCTRTPFQKGTICAGGNACLHAQCDGDGTCLTAPNVTCNSPPNQQCWNANGTCNNSTGECDYEPAYPISCEPDPAVKTPKCDRYVCTQGTCSVGCIIAVCGNGIIESPEQCDYASPLYRTGCCSSNCTFLDATNNCELVYAYSSKEALANSNYSEHSSSNTKCIVGVCGNSGVCEPSWNISIPGCQFRSRNRALAIGLGAGLSAGLLLLCLCCLLIALIAWRLKRSPVSKETAEMMEMAQPNWNDGEGNPTYLSARVNKYNAVHERANS